MSTFTTGIIQHADASIPMVSTKLKTTDFIGSVMVRWGFRRDHYRVTPGLYAVGQPDATSDVFVTANYKLTFDNVRKNLSGINGWILVLDTKGVNVWCAAGKGTFATKELVNRIRQVSLDKVVNHRRIILPQLGATGVAAYKVKEETGFNVHYGPVRAADIQKFISDGYRADKKMRRVTFSLMDRIKLVPNDFMSGKLYLLGAVVLILLISGFSSNGFSFSNLITKGGSAVLNIFLAYASGVVLTPILLPYLPPRQFSVKGFYTGFLVFIVMLLLGFTGASVVEILSWFFIMTAISSFLAMNFTGSSTYTSLSGVKKEMKFSLPVQIGFAATGIILQVLGKFI